MKIAPIVADPLSQVGVLSDYAAWKRERLERHPLFSHREKLWDTMVDRLSRKEGLVALEFGVAWGYATNWWLSRLRDPRLEWHGFDTFTGLPTTWDRAGLTVYDAGSFSAQGNTPAIPDARTRWHVGRVGDTIGEVDWTQIGTRPLFLFLDFDLYEPTHIALEAAAPYLKPGDVLYFDEAFDAWNERKAIDETLLPRYTVTTLGSTATALALEIAGPRG